MKPALPFASGPSGSNRARPRPASASSGRQSARATAASPTRGSAGVGVGECVEQRVRRVRPLRGTRHIGDGAQRDQQLLPVLGARDGLQQGDHLPVLGSDGRFGIHSQPTEQVGKLRGDGPLGRHPIGVEQGAQPQPPGPDRRFLPREVAVEFFEYLSKITTGVLRKDVADLGEAEPQLGQPPDPGERDGVPQPVVAVAVGAPLGLGQQPEMVVVPHGPRRDTDGDGKLSDPHAPSRNVDVAAGSSVSGGTR